MGRELSLTFGFEFRRRYLLAPTDPRYLDATEDEMEVDVWAHRFFDDPRMYREEENESFDDDLAEMEAELGVPAFDPGDKAGGMTAEGTGAAPPAPPGDDPAEWEDVVDDRSTAL